MRPTRFQPKDALQAFAQKKVLTRPELLRACGCSTMTAWRILHREGYLTSYNHNAKYYTLARIPRFDEQGLWAYQGIRFSKWGTLSKTVVGLVEQSPAGMTASELEKALHVPNLKPLLTRLAGQAQMQRAEIGGSLVYLAVEFARGQQQFQGREREVVAKRAAESLPALAEINALLVAMIRHPQDTPRQWARRLSRQGIRLKTGQIQAVIDHYRLDVKKGLSSS